MCGRTATHKGIEWTCEVRMHIDTALIYAELILKRTLSYVELHTSLGRPHAPSFVQSRALELVRHVFFFLECVLTWRAKLLECTRFLQTGQGRVE